MSKKIRAAKINALSATMKRIKATFDAAEAEGTTGGLAVLAGQVETAMGILGDLKKSEEKEAAKAAAVPVTDEEGDEPKKGEDEFGDEEVTEDEDEEVTEDEDEELTEDDEESTEGKGMDAAYVRKIVRSTQRQLAKGMTGKNVFADQVSSLIGSFDHSEMLTKSDVAKYAVKKLGLSPAKGHELTAVQSFLAAKGTAQPVARVTGMDARDTKKPSLVLAHINSAK